MPEAELKDCQALCCNEECGWQGLASECVMLGAIGPLCPECHEVTEQADSRQ